MLMPSMWLGYWGISLYSVSAKIVPPTLIVFKSTPSRSWLTLLMSGPFVIGGMFRPLETDEWFSSSKSSWSFACSRICSSSFVAGLNSGKWSSEIFALVTDSFLLSEGFCLNCAAVAAWRAGPPEEPNGVRSKWKEPIFLVSRIF